MLRAAQNAQHNMFELGVKKLEIDTQNQSIQNEEDNWMIQKNDQPGNGAEIQDLVEEKD